MDHKVAAEMTAAERAMITAHHEAHKKGDEKTAVRILQDFHELYIMRQNAPQLAALHSKHVTQADCVEIVRLFARGANAADNLQLLFDELIDPMLADHASIREYAEKYPDKYRDLRTDCLGPGLVYAFIARDRQRRTQSV